MNFALVSPNDVNFNKIMMQKHLEQKKQRKCHLSQNIDPAISQDFSRLSLSQSLPLAGQKLIETNQIKEYNYVLSGSPTNLREKRKKYSNQEQQRMKETIKRDLVESVLEEKSRKAKQDEERRKVGVEMSKQNGILDYLQKQIDKRNNFIKMCLVNQEVRKKNFFDEDYRKHCQVLQHIQTNFDPDVFNHISDKYQEQQKINLQKMLQTNQIQAGLNQSTRKMERNEYGKYFDEKYRRQKHNPITNPLQYHIDNPCIKKYISLN